MESKRTSTTYFIPPGKFLLMENALGNPDLIQSSVSSDCRVTIVDTANFPLDELEQWPTFRLTSSDVKLKLGEGLYYVYIVVPAPDNGDTSTAFISYNTVLVDRKGYDAEGKLVGKEKFCYYQCGTVSARGGNPSAVTTPSGQGRVIEVDLGVTPAPSTLPGGLNDFDQIFQLDKVDPGNPKSWLLFILATVKEMTARLIRITGSLVFGSGESEKRVTDVALSGQSADAASVSDNIIPTTAWVDARFLVLDDRYLRKDQDDRSVGTIASDKGFLVGNEGKGFSVGENGTVTAIIDQLLEIVGIQSKDFSMGEFGNGFVLKYENGKSYLEVDEMLVRRVAYFVELIIKQLSHVGGTLVLSPASMRCTKVEEYEEYYRCFFENEKDGKTINQEFEVGDQARSQTFNVKEGVNQNVSNQYYWRLVVGIGDNYIDLSKIDCDNGSLAPLVGDDIVQLGNRYKPGRQNAIILSTVGDDAPSFKQYSGINSYSLEGKETTVISPKGNVITGDFQSKSGARLEDVINELGVRLDDVVTQTDQTLTIWFENYDPSENNYPTNEWIDQAAKEEHVEDIFYNQEAGMAWRYQEVSEGVYAWVVITDQETIKALEKASKAQATADKKMQNFITQPVPPYSVGDRWSNAVYGTQYDNDELVCINAKAQGESFSINDWQLVSSMSSADKKHFYSEFKRTDNSIQRLVADGKTKDEAIAAAKAAAKAASDAASAAVQTANSANKTATNNATAIDQTNQYLSLVAAAFETNADGSLKLDANGKPILTKAAGVVITADAAGLYAKQSDVTAEFDVRVKFDPKTGKVLSAIKMSADQIDISANDYIRIINGGTTTIKSERLDLVGKVTFSMLDSNAQSTINGKATTGDIDSKITAYDKTLGSLAKLSAVEKAQLGSTIISGGYIKGELLNVTEVHATSGSIAGFKISNNNLTNEGFSSDAAVIFKYNNNIAAIGSNVIPIESGANGAAYFQCHTEDSSRAAKNYGMVVSAAGTGENVAIGMDGGCIEGFAMKNRIISGSGTVELSIVDYNVIVTSSSDCVLELPAMRLCDDGHVVRIKRLGSGGVTFKAKQCETFTSGTTGRNHPGIIYGSGKHVGSGNVAEEDKMSQYDSCEFVWVRDLRITIGGTLYNGAWIQYKMPKSW